MSKGIILIGLGPHAKRIYIKLMKKYGVLPSVIVDLQRNENDIKTYLNDENIFCDIYLVPDLEADNITLSSKVSDDLKSLIKKHDIHYAIISTEPKAHFAYAKFFLKENINILMDKPITAPLFVFDSISNSQKIKREYEVLKRAYLKKNNLNFVIQCQRRFHAGYRYVKELINDTVKKYHVPVTYLDVYHSDGMWNMPNEFFIRENHPYKYGYGKLFHSGYHFVDLITWLLECNNQLPDKKINNVHVSTSLFKPGDFFTTIDNNFYQKYLNTSYKDILNNKDDVANFGELDFHAMLDFKKNNHIITHCNLNLLQSGLSKRAWSELPIDTYKANGRIRHERIDIQIGPIMNIQIHSYQSSEINEKNDIPDYEIGSLDHFDIYIFRNNNLIGGKAFEKISIKDLIVNNDFLGNNEKARENCFKEYINDIKGESDLLKHESSILLLSKLCESVSNQNNMLDFKWRIK